jgi:hypothetical protein
MQYEMTLFKHSSITLACLTLVLEELGFETFLEGLLSLIQEYGIPFDFEQVLECKQILIL